MSLSQSKAFHSLIELALQGESNTDVSSKEEAWGYYQDVTEIVQKAKGDYPEIEILWLMTKAWNSGIHMFSAAKYGEAAQWCEQGIRLLKHLGSLRANYEQQMTKVYSEILEKLDNQTTKMA